MNIIRWTEDLLYKKPFWLVSGTIFLLAIFKTGIWYIPNLDMSLAVAQNPFVNPFPDPIAHYLFWNWLSPFLAWCIGAHGRVSFFAFHFAFSMGFVFLFLLLVKKRLREPFARTAVIMFFILPVSMTSMFWVGPDSVTLFLFVVAMLYSERRAVTMLLGILLGMQHFEQAFFAVAAVTFSFVLLNTLKKEENLPLSIVWALMLLAGVVVGKTMLYLIFYWNNIEVPSGRLFWLKQFWPEILKQFYYHFQTVIWATLGLGWIFVIRYLEMGKMAFPFLFTLAGLLCLTPFLGDQTRAICIVTFPLITALIMINERFLNRLESRFVTIIFVVWLLMPWGWVWGGVPRGSVISYDFTLVMHHLFGWFSIPKDISLWPF